MSDDETTAKDSPEEIEVLKDVAIKTSMPRRFNRRKTDRNNSTRSMWLLSFTDVMALMLTFFVLMFSMSNPKQEEWQEFTKQIQKNFNVFDGPALNRGAEDAIDIKKTNFSKALSLTYLRALMDDVMKQNPELGEVLLIDNHDSLIVSLPQNMLFDSGAAALKPEASKALFILSDRLNKIKNRLEIIGHTDPRPITGGDFSSNWELSLARAANVAATLKSVGYKREISIRGQSSGRFNDLPDTLSEQERLDLSRRVDIVIMEDDGRSLRLFDLGQKF